MTVTELIEQLSCFPGDMVVCTVDNETGMHESVTDPSLENGRYWVGTGTREGEHICV